jgi:hypothetical protein
MRNFHILIAAAALCSGCANYLYAEPPGFGQSVVGARASQVIDPNAPSKARAAPVADGQAAKAAVDRYQKSFETPPAPVNVLNIGIGSGNSGGSSGQ